MPAPSALSRKVGSVTGCRVDRGPVTGDGLGATQAGPRDRPVDAGQRTLCVASDPRLQRTRRGAGPKMERGQTEEGGPGNA